MKDKYQARMLRIHFGEGDKWRGKPLHEAIVAKCMERALEFTMPVIGRFPRTHRSW
jgi:PII-like signaling protein